MCDNFKPLTKAMLKLYFKGTIAQLGELVPPIQAISAWQSSENWEGGSNYKGATYRLCKYF